MKVKNIVSSILVSMSLLGCLSLSVLITNDVNANGMKKTEKLSNEISLESDNITVSIEMSRDEMIQSISNELGISKEQAEQTISNGNERLKLQVNNERFVLVRAAWQDHQINHSIEGGTAYFYCKITASGGFRAIKEIVYAGFNHPKYGFSGTLQYGLPDPNRIHYTLNGALYNHATTSVSGGGSVGLNGVGSVNMNSTVTSNFVKNVFVTKDVRF
ncbi:hypothetical protein ACTNBL_10795 [Enterococcus villorum]|uniref:DUF5626 domain-containing protein n=2 Tax=Enterococcus villorum TaxID=112904 RepID=A0A511J0T5_9ENTE|nr:hypothetical protein [Enterococcus villorum]EOH88948.1 hypothetical protein UAO_01680 [Enterococcus villorum ATCC 700913]EOW76215.1 hypothetical protein I591_01517 [Enterococcus villorum ATCC 700913]GEL91269.1 hypothetical protein EVI01_06060 [Enterococcus villorum]